MSETKAKPCHRCSTAPAVTPGSFCTSVYCDGCYDGAPDSGCRGEIGWGFNLADAIEDWNAIQEERADEQATA